VSRVLNILDEHIDWAEGPRSERELLEVRDSVVEDHIKIEALTKALEWYVNRHPAIQAKFELYGPADTAAAMRGAYVNANDALAMVRS
jgi:predicted glycosyltransferase